jgi:7-cyano-7-deazaguanine synthase
MTPHTAPARAQETENETEKRPLAICLVSGGLDSCVTAAIANQRCRLAFLHVNYGQLTERRELEAFEAIAGHYRVETRLIADISYLKDIGGSALTDPSIPIPRNGPGKPGIPVTYVPFRNTHLAAIAVSWGEVIGAEYIYIGATEVDSSGYPDCRESYFTVLNQLIREGTRPETRIEIVTPIIRYDKGRVVKEGLRLDAPLDLTWSCYENEKIGCGTCDSCLLRLKGFAAAGAKDPIPYA